MGKAGGEAGRGGVVGSEKVALKHQRNSRPENPDRAVHSGGGCGGAGGLRKGTLINGGGKLQRRQQRRSGVRPEQEQERERAGPVLEHAARTAAVKGREELVLPARVTAGEPGGIRFRGRRVAGSVEQQQAEVRGQTHSSKPLTLAGIY